MRKAPVVQITPMSSCLRNIVMNQDSCATMHFVNMFPPAIPFLGTNVGSPPNPFVRTSSEKERHRKSSLKKSFEVKSEP